ncbi:MAG: hypothetical protein IPP46_04750 [Bacteroidetes bacterium]|nr:hypothetical protein [Bacteroidota bacterium]
MNIIDAVAPTSSIDSLPSNTTADSVIISWSETMMQVDQVLLSMIFMFLIIIALISYYILISPIHSKYFME